MKRLNNLFEQIYDIENIKLADENARKNKGKRKDIIKHDLNRDEENEKLAVIIKNLKYSTSQYSTFKIYEPKERIIFKLPYYPDRITHHAIMNIMEPIWTNIFIKQTYSCIKGRGIHKLHSDLSTALLKDKNGTKYFLKLDIQKFYPSIDHKILISILYKKIKDERLMSLLKEIIHSSKGVPIGNYLSLFFANLYLAYFDHWIKEELKCKYYYRYADDIVILSNDKNKLHNILVSIKLYLTNLLKLNIKNNYKIGDINKDGIDFVGYVFKHTYIKLRKSIKIRAIKNIKYYKLNRINLELLRRIFCSYFGWLKYCNSKHLLFKVKGLTGLNFSNWNGIDSNISNFYNKNINIVGVLYYNKYYKLNIVYKNIKYSLKTRSTRLLNRISPDNSSHFKIYNNGNKKNNLRGKTWYNRILK